VPAAARSAIQQLMSTHAGVLRDLKGLDEAERGLAELGVVDSAGGAAATPGTESWEATNLLTVATVLVRAAKLREETRGSHWRDDHPDTDDARWRGHLDTTLDGDGQLHTDYVPTGSAS
jgi:L-aspartate oxidase